jgi:hypothetical protein
MLLGVTRGYCAAFDEVNIGDTPVSSFAEITWQQCDPNTVPDGSIFDARWLTCQDLAQIELPDGGASPIGPYPANPASTVIQFVSLISCCRAAAGSSSTASMRR